MTLTELIPTFKGVVNFEPHYTFTVFTPVFNRADTLERVFNSLNNQTFKDFELVLINDGSTDNSHAVAQDLIKTAEFPIQYINNSKNQHKMACFFQAIEMAKGQFILPFDSDDECLPDALQIFHEEYLAIPNDKKDKISGVTCLCEDQNGNLIGQKFPKSPYYSNTFLQNIESPLTSEKWGFTRTNILKGIHIDKNVFSKGYIPEGIIWELLSKEGYGTKYINEVLRIYYLDTENRISIQNHEKDAFGMAIYSLAILNWFQNDYLLKTPKLFIKRCYTLLRAAHYLEFNLKDYLNAIENKMLKFVFFMGWPFKRLF
ncbi:glycosyltransferase family 2 protein [Hanstruepera marina]|uniref:glycosyltransferase family 2 protein n=1 Tax=Hanstruepera marina TaxID=2873265 RepID=UPI001CA79F8C|nr:glycosyltransferase family 2 protein [Hanstruepera marina]